MPSISHSTSSGNPHPSAALVKRKGARRYLLDEDFFAGITDESRAYFLGFIAADGHCSRYRLSIKLASRDHGHLVKLAALLETNIPIANRRGFSFGKLREYSELSVCSVKLCEDLAKYGMVGKKTHRVTPWVGPEDLMPHWWRGIWDGDGWISIRPTKRGEEYRQVGICGTEAVALGFSQFIQQRTGIEGRIGYGCPGVVRCTYTGLRNAQAVVSLLYANQTLCLERKKIFIDRLLATEPQLCDFRDMTKENLLALKKTHGTWTAVAKAIGSTEGSIWFLRRRLGIKREFQDWSQLRQEDLEISYQKTGSWVGVSADLGIAYGHLRRLRKRLLR